VRRSDWSGAVNDVRSSARTGAVRDLPTEAGDLEVPGGGFRLAGREKVETVRSFNIVSVGEDLLTSGAVVVDVVNGVLGIGVGATTSGSDHVGHRVRCRSASAISRC